jgi:hypothetical protein
MVDVNGGLSRAGRMGAVSLPEAHMQESARPGAQMRYAAETDHDQFAE